jgi:hypothetical protein
LPSRRCKMVLSRRAKASSLPKRSRQPAHVFQGIIADISKCTVAQRRDAPEVQLAPLGGGGKVVPWLSPAAARAQHRVQVRVDLHRPASQRRRT